MNLEQSTKERIYVFVDGPNFTESSNQNRVRLDIPLMKQYFTKYGDIGKFFWYDLNPEISSVDIDRTPIKNLEKFFNLDGKNGNDYSSKREDFLEDLKKDENALNDLVSFFYSIRTSFIIKEKKEKFLQAIGQHVDLLLGKVSTFKEFRNCSNCNSEVSFMGKTEAGRTDFNLATDMIYYAAKNKYDSAILVSGDGHFTKPVKLVKDLDKKVFVFSFENTVSESLKSISTDFIDFNLIKQEIERRN